MAMAMCTSTTVEPLTLESASRYIYDCALVESEIGVVGLELETHLVDLAAARIRPAWARLRPAIEPAHPEVVDDDEQRHREHRHR